MHAVANQHGIHRAAEDESRRPSTVRLALACDVRRPQVSVVPLRLHPSYGGLTRSTSHAVNSAHVTDISPMGVVLSGGLDSGQAPSLNATW